jgi:hypothetical protein
VGQRIYIRPIPNESIADGFFSLLKNAISQ